MPRISERILYLVFILFVFSMSHLSYINNGFTWLDHQDIEDKAAVVPLNNISTIVFNNYSNTRYYRPVVTWVHSVDYALFHDNPTGFHITNILIMMFIIGASLPFLSCFTKMNDQEKIVIALLISVHPLGWLPVGSISYRPELLYVLFTELTLICHVYYRQKGHFIYRLGALLFFLLALFSKETSLVLVPFFIIVWEYVYRHSIKKPFPYLFIGEEILVLIIFLILKISAVGTFWASRNYPMTFFENMGTRIVVIGKLVEMLINPLLPPLSDSTKIINIVTIQPIYYLILLILLILLLRKLKDKNITLGILLIGITLLPALNILSLPRFISPHYAFFSMIMTSSVMVLILRKFNKTVKTISIFFLLTIILFMEIHTFQGGNRFKNDYTLFYPEVLKDDNFLEGHYYLGDYYYSQNKIQKTESEYTYSLRSNPGIIAYVDQTSALIKLANIKRIRKKYAEAGALLDKAGQDPDKRIKDVVIYDKATLAYEMGNYKKAEEILESSSISWKENANASRLLLSRYKKLGEEEKITNFLKKISQE